MRLRWEGPRCNEDATASREERYKRGIALCGRIDRMARGTSVLTARREPSSDSRDLDVVPSAPVAQRTCPVNGCVGRISVGAA